MMEMIAVAHASPSLIIISSHHDGWQVRIVGYKRRAFVKFSSELCRLPEMGSIKQKTI